jgi:predicted nuclease with TOPRIM domain
MYSKKHLLEEIAHKQDRILSELRDLRRKVDAVMAVAQDLQTALASLDAETSAVGENVKQLASRITNSMTDAEVADLKAHFGLVSDHLKSLAVDPTVPVPPEPPALAALRKKMKAKP